MSVSQINVGSSPGSRDGDPLRRGGEIINENFQFIVATLATLAPSDSAVLTGHPRAPTQPPETVSDEIATMEALHNAVTTLVGAAPEELSSLAALAGAVGNNPDYANAVSAALNLRAALAGADFTGPVTAPAPASGDNSTRLVNSAWVQAALAGFSGGGGGGSGNVISGLGVPSAPPPAAGFLYVDGETGEIYASRDSTSVADWILQLNTESGAPLTVSNDPPDSWQVQLYDDQTGLAYISSLLAIYAAHGVVRTDAAGVIQNPRAAAASYDAGTVTAGTFTPDVADGQFQHLTNNGAHELTPPATLGTVVITYTNGPSAGPVTFTGFAPPNGALDTVAGKRFQLSICRCHGGATLSIWPLS